MSMIAIDQSYTSCGIVVLDGSVVLHAEKFTSDPEKDIFERAEAVAAHITKVALQYKVEYVAMEGLAFSKFGNATRDLAGLQFTIVHQLKFCRGYEIIIIPPTTVKKFATGKGNAKKGELLEYLPKNTRIFFESLGVKKTTGLLDLTDAYWIGLAAQEKRKNEGNSE